MVRHITRALGGGGPAVRTALLAARISYTHTNALRVTDISTACVPMDPRSMDRILLDVLTQMTQRGLLNSWHSRYISGSRLRFGASQSSACPTEHCSSGDETQ